MYGTKKCSIVMYGTKKCFSVMHGTKVFHSHVWNKKVFHCHVWAEKVFHSNKSFYKFIARGLVTKRSFSLVNRLCDKKCKSIF
jgi:hypothetical protein